MQCENGRVVVSIQLHDWSKSVIAQRILSVDEFITAVHDILGPVSCYEPTNNSILESSFVESDKENCSEVVSTGAKRYSTVNSPKSPSKKLKYIDDSLDEEIERCKKGIYKNTVS